MAEERSEVQALHPTLLGDEQMSLAEFIGLCLADGQPPCRAVGRKALGL